MERIRFSDTERRVLLSIRHDVDLKDLKGISKESLVTAVKYLTDKGLIKSLISYNEVIDYELQSFGIAYLEEYPYLENPPDDELLKSLQINELKYKKRIRKQEYIIRLWQLIGAVAGIAGVVGWFLFLVAK